MFKLLPILLTLLLLSGCNDSKASTADQSQRKATEASLAEANRQVGMPNIANFTERKLMKMILELRDQDGLATWTYIVDMHGELHFLTESIGYGLPYSTQFTSPSKPVYRGASSNRTGLVVPQADPNGLFMPDGLSATWIIASTEDGPRPLYVEPAIIVSPVKLH